MYGANGNRNVGRRNRNNGKEILTSLPHICAQYAVPFQCSRSCGELLVLVDIGRSAHLVKLLVKFEHGAVTRRRGRFHQLHQRPYDLLGHGILEAGNCIISGEGRPTENKHLDGEARKRGSYVFVPGSVLLEPADHSPPISWTWSGAVQAIMTIEQWEANDELLVEQRSYFQESTTYTNAILEHQLPKEPSPLLNL